MARFPNIPLVIALLLWTPIAVAQATLGTILDAGATKLSLDEFKSEIVQHTVFGPTVTGGTMEVMYASNGSIQGIGTPPSALRLTAMAPISGQWNAGENGSICMSIRMGADGGGQTSGFTFPPRCQVWFRLGEKYFLSDSDSDRDTVALVRTIRK